MPVYQHRLERRSQKLQDALEQRIQIMATSLRPPGQRPPFTELLSKQKALDWWVTHFTGPAGQAALAYMGPEAQLELEQALSAEIERRQMAAGQRPPGGTGFG